MSKNVGIFVGEDNDSFFTEIGEDIVSRYKTELYKRREYNFPLLYGRINHYAFQSGINGVLRRNDVCFFEWASELLAVASHLPKQCKIITRMHSFELYDWAPQVNWDAVDKIIFVSQAMRARFIELYPKQANKTVVIWNGVRLDKFRPPSSRDFSYRLGMLSNILPIKRIYEIILVMDDMRSLDIPVTLHIAGEPKGDLRYANAVYRLVDRLELQDRVKFYGHIEHAETWLQEIDIFISNSYWEGQQVSLLEALATGCYSLSHFWTGVEEVLPQDNIYVTKDELISKIVEYIKLPNEMKLESQKKMRELATLKFDIENTKKEILQVILQLIDR